jgi:hypothetical protein
MILTPNGAYTLSGFGLLTPSLASLKRERKNLLKKIRYEERSARGGGPAGYRARQLLKSYRSQLQNLEWQIENFEKTTPTERKLTREQRVAQRQRTEAWGESAQANKLILRQRAEQHAKQAQVDLKNMPVSEQDTILMRNEAYQRMAGKVPKDVREYLLKQRNMQGNIARAIADPLKGGTSKADAAVYEMYRQRAGVVSRAMDRAKGRLADIERMKQEIPIVGPGLLELFRQQHPDWSEAQVRQAVAQQITGGGGGPPIGKPVLPAAAQPASEEKKDLPGWLIPVAAAGLLILGGGGGA